MHLLVHLGLRACAACLLAATSQARAASADWVAVDPATLDTLRGRFTTSRGLAVSLGVERLVAINGSVVARTSFQVTGLGRPDAGAAALSGAPLSALKLVQNGGDNMMLTGFSGAMLAGTVIQNTLSDQRIDSRTTINASVNSAGLLQAINFNGSVSDGIARAVVPR